MLVNTEMKRLIRGLVIVLMCAWSSADAFEWPKFPEPPQSTVKWMLQDSQLNGVPMKVKVFSSDASVDKVLAYYRRKWGEASAQNSFDQWEQISHLNKRFLLLVQVQKDGKGSWGRLSVSKLEKSAAKPGSGVPFMRNSQIVSDMFDQDNGWNARTTSLVNQYSLVSNRSFYQKHYLGKGWQAYLAQSRKASTVLVFRSGSESVNISLYNGNGITRVLVNHINRTMLSP